MIIKAYKLIIFDWHGTLMQPEFSVSPEFVTIEEILFPGVIKTLQQLKQQHYQLALATTMPSATIRQLLTDEALTGLFTTWRSADQTAAKPKPLMIMEILEELNIKPEQAVMIGDSISDIRLAHNAGIDAIAISSTEEKAVLRAFKPKTVLTSVNELIL